MDQVFRQRSDRARGPRSSRWVSPSPDGHRSQRCPTAAGSAGAACDPGPERSPGSIAARAPGPSPALPAGTSPASGPAAPPSGNRHSGPSGDTSRICASCNLPSSGSQSRRRKRRPAAAPSGDVPNVRRQDMDGLADRLCRSQRNHRDDPPRRDDERQQPSLPGLFPVGLGIGGTTWL